jgi:bifunctional UDP-N-acetylglucosamine pyrophosphorylase/glucosamine-1-phosphate N-acetyltransferase
MRRSLLAVVWAGRRAPGAGRPEVPPDLPLCGKSILRWSLEKAAALGPKRVFILGNPDSIRVALPADSGAFGVLAADDTSGTLDEIFSGEKSGAGGSNIDILVLHPGIALVGAATLRRLIAQHREGGKVATFLKESVSVGGRPRRAGPTAGPDWDAVIVRRDDLSAVLARAGRRQDLASRLSRALTALAGRPQNTGVVCLPESDGWLAVRGSADASRVRAHLYQQKLARLERGGVTVLDGGATWIDWDARVGPGTIIHPAVVIQGASTIGRDCRLHPFVHLVDARVGDRVEILSSTVIEGARVGRCARVGPFTHFRPGTVIKAGARVGNFVEMKNTVFGRRSLASHLSYLGDATVGDDVNIGAGTITCNFDRFRKNRTAIGRGAFIGSGTELIAPVKVGRNAVVGAGSTITKNVSPWALAVARGRQIEIKNWAKRKPGK